MLKSYPRTEVQKNDWKRGVSSIYTATRSAFLDFKYAGNLNFNYYQHTDVKRYSYFK